MEVGRKRWGFVEFDVRLCGEESVMFIGSEVWDW